MDQFQDSIVNWIVGLSNEPMDECCDESDRRAHW